MEQQNLQIINQTIWLRICQILVNEKYKKGEFQIPIHLALGHEAIAVAVDHNMNPNDSIFLTHRNIHYNLARQKSLRAELDEYYLKESGIANGQLGSMNMSNHKKGVIYTSSILGNNLSVGSGYALGNKLKLEKAVVFIVTGDGALEEGAFYESLLFLKSHNLAVIIIVENNEWSLATKINDRRCNINLKKLADSLDISYLALSGNDPIQYSSKICSARKDSISKKTPILIEVNLTTLGYWYKKTKDFPKGKFINYHAGPAPEVNKEEYPLISSSSKDPLFVLKKYLTEEELTKTSLEAFKKLELELA